MTSMANNTNSMKWILTRAFEYQINVLISVFVP